MTVKELHTLSAIELDIVIDALRVAKAHYGELAEIVGRHTGFREAFEHQAKDASTLQLKLEASR